MMRIKTYLDKTERGDLGLYAAQNISQGTIVWVYDEGFEKIFTDEEVNNMSILTKEYVKKYSYQKSDDKTWVLCIDDNKFLNHSDAPNLEDFETHSVAVVDIKKGQELTCNYYGFDAQADKKLSNDFS